MKKATVKSHTRSTKGKKNSTVKTHTRTKKKNSKDSLYDLSSYKPKKPKSVAQKRADTFKKLQNKHPHEGGIKPYR